MNLAGQLTDGHLEGSVGDRDRYHHKPIQVSTNCAGKGRADGYWTWDAELAGSRFRWPSGPGPCRAWICPR